MLSLVAFFLSTCLLTSTDAISDEPILILLSFDGFRHDYLYRPNLTHFTHLREQWAFVPDVRPVFPSKTFPNHVTMATGLYTESHGVIGPYINASSGHLMDVNETEYWNYNSDAVKPIWALNEAASEERFSGCMMWPGCQSGEPASPPTYAQDYNRSLPWRDRVSMVFDWLRDPEQPANLVLWYVEEPDFTAHKYGPDSAQVGEQLRRVDDLLGYIEATLRLFELQERVNLVVTSDHGMTAVPGSHLISLDALLPADWYRALGPDPVLRIVPAPGKSLAVYDALRDGAEKLGLNYTVYVKEKIPERWHYRRNPRVPDILLVADEGYLFTTEYINSTVETLRQRNLSVTLGNHGYDPALASMAHPLLARGPAFRHRLLLETTLENTDVFALSQLVLQLPETASNGSRSRVQPLLAPASLAFWRRAGGTAFWAAVVTSVAFGVCMLSLVFVIIRRRFRRQTVSPAIVNGYKFRYSPVHRKRQSRRVNVAPPGSGSEDDDVEEGDRLLPAAGAPSSGV